MTWVRLDDQFYANRKVNQAWTMNRASLGLHMLALSYCAGQLTDGLVDEWFVNEKVTNARQRNSATTALEQSGLWKRETGGWRINDYLDFNPSRKDVLERRGRDSERKRRKDSERNPDGIHAESNGMPHDPSRARALTRPDPTHKTPPPPQAGEPEALTKRAERARAGSKRKRDRQALAAVEPKTNWAAWAEANVPDLPADIAAMAAGALSGRGHEVDADRVRRRVLSQYPHLAEGEAA